MDTQNLRAIPGGFAEAPLGFRQVFVGIARASHLDEAHAEFGSLHIPIVAAAALFAVRR